MKIKKRSPWTLLVNVIVLAIFLRFILNRFGSIDQLVGAAGQFYADFGPLILFISGLIEAVIIIGLYYPGSTIILLGATLAGTHVISLPAVIIWTTAGMITGYILSFMIGRAHWDKLIQKFGLQEYIDDFDRTARRHKFIYALVTFHPNIAAIASTALGLSKTGFWSFLWQISLFQILWSTIWSLIFYFFGLFILNRFLIFTGLMIFGLILYFFREKIVLFLNKLTKRKKDD